MLDDDILVRGRLAAVKALRELGAPYGKDRFPLRPFVLPATTADRIAEACATVVEGFDHIVDVVCAGDLVRLARLCRVPDHELRLWDVQAGHDWAMLARPDVLLSGDRIILAELNAAPQASQFAYHDIQVRAEASVDGYVEALPPQASQFAYHDIQVRAEASVDGYVEALPPLRETPAAMPPYVELFREQMLVPGVLALCYWAREARQGPVSWSYTLHAHELGNHGVTARTAAVEDLVIGGGGVWLGDERVAAVHRYFESPPADDAASRALIDRLADSANRGDVGVVTGFRGEVFASKMCLSLLSDEACTTALPPDLVQRLGQCVPWTRVVEKRETSFEGERVDLLSLLCARRDRFVLKPSRGYGGGELHVGRETADDTWRMLIRRAAADKVPWLAQELIIPDDQLVAGLDTGGRLHETRSPAVYGALHVRRNLVGITRRQSLGSGRSLNINIRQGMVPAPVG